MMVLNYVHKFFDILPFKKEILVPVLLNVNLTSRLNSKEQNMVEAHKKQYGFLLLFLRSPTSLQGKLLVPSGGHSSSFMERSTW